MFGLTTKNLCIAGFSSFLLDDLFLNQTRVLLWFSKTGKIAFQKGLSREGREKYEEVKNP